MAVFIINLFFFPFHVKTEVDELTIHFVCNVFAGYQCIFKSCQFLNENRFLTIVFFENQKLLTDQNHSLVTGKRRVRPGIGQIFVR